MGRGCEGPEGPTDRPVGMKCHECDEHTLKPPGWAGPAELAWSSSAITLENTAPNAPCRFPPHSPPCPRLSLSPQGTQNRGCHPCPGPEMLWLSMPLPGDLSFYPYTILQLTKCLRYTSSLLQQTLIVSCHPDTGDDKHLSRSTYVQDHNGMVLG